MRRSAIYLGVLLGLGTGAASAQGVNLTGRYICINCPHGGPDVGFITQSGWNLNLVNELGQPSRGYVDYPGRIWAPDWNEGAMVSPDGMTIQFDRGAVWRRDGDEH
jgi:hypothetical protein